jgi:hypothetical protein
MNIYSLLIFASWRETAVFIVIFNKPSRLVSGVLHKNYEKKKVFQKGLTNA